MGSLFSGSTESKVKIPEWLEEAAKSNLGQAQDVASIGYTPYYGADVAAFNPMQSAGFQNTADASRAFGLSAPTDAMAGMPQAQNFGGVMGYSSQPLFSDAVSRFEQDRPAQKALIDSFFIDPRTGAQGSGSIANSGTNAPFTPSTGGVTMQQAQQQDINSTPAVIPTSPYNPPAYNQQEQQAIMQQELAQANEGLTPQAPSQFMQTANALYPNVTQPITPDTIGSMDFSSPFEGNVPNVTVDSLSQAGDFQPDFYAQSQDPSMMDQIAQGAGTIGREILDSSGLGVMNRIGNRVAPDTFTSESLSDMIFGQQTPLSNSQLVAADGVNVLSGEMNQGLDGVNQFLQDTAQYGQPNVQTQPQFETIVVDDRPVLTAPNSFYNAGNMLDQSPATQSTVKNLFDELDKTNGKRKPPKQIKRNFNKVR
jgi:hypothetical protein